MQFTSFVSKSEKYFHVDVYQILLYLQLLPVFAIYIYFLFILYVFPPDHS